MFYNMKNIYDLTLFNNMGVFLRQQKLKEYERSIEISQIACP